MKLRFLGGVLALTTACTTAVGSGQESDAGPNVSKDGGATATKDAAAAKKDAGGTSTDDASVVQPTDDAGPVDDTTCAAQTTRSACEQCCLTVHPSGYKVYEQELIDCECNTPAACATECASELCASKPTTANDACSQCITASLTQGGACYDGIANACQADTDCTSLFGTCIPPCETLQ